MTQQELESDYELVHGNPHAPHGLCNFLEIGGKTVCILEPELRKCNPVFGEEGTIYRKVPKY